MMFKKIKRRTGGQMAVELLFLTAIVITLVGGFISLAASFLQSSVRAENKLQAFSAAEAGIEYYRWHLAHAPGDYWDGNTPGTPGPYTHDYYDKNGTKIGQFILTITGPATGTTAVAINSTGRVLADNSITKSIKVVISPSSLLQYNIVQNTDLVVGSAAVTQGPVMSNGGVHFDGLAQNIVQSALTTYSDFSENSHPTEWAVHTQDSPADPHPPTPLPLRPDVFTAGRQLAVPAADFSGLSQVLSNIQALGQAGGVNYGSSGAYGYDLQLATTTTSTVYSVYKVTAIAAPPNGCTNTSNVPGWGTWSVGTETLLATGTVPSNGAFFFGDNLWVQGTVQNARLTIGAAVFPDNPNTWASISVNHNLTYAGYSGSSSVLMVTQNNINVGLMSDDVLRIDSALLTEYGRTGRFYYQPPNNQTHSNKCAPWASRTSLTIYGSIASNGAAGFGYSDGTGYASRTYLYDPNFYRNPPSVIDPLFHGLQLMSWQEVQ